MYICRYRHYINIYNFVNPLLKRVLGIRVDAHFVGSGLDLTMTAMRIGIFTCGASLIRIRTQVSRL